MSKRSDQATQQKATVKKAKKTAFKNSDKFFMEVNSRLKKNVAVKSKPAKPTRTNKAAKEETVYQQTTKKAKAPATKAAKAAPKTTKTSARTVTRSTAKTTPTKTSRVRKTEPEETIVTPVTGSTEKSSTPFKLSKKLWLLVLLVGIVALVVFLGNKFLVVAWVDKKPITRWEYYQTMDKKYGNDIREQMIVEKLITSEASKRGVTVSNAEVSAEIKKFEDEQGGADKLNQILQLQGLSRDDLNRLVKLQLLKQKIFGGNVNVTDDQVTQYMQQNKDQLPDLTNADASTSAKIKSQVTDQIKQQQINQNFQTWLNQNLQSNRVVRN